MSDVLTSLEFFRLREDSSWTKVHHTEVVKNTLNPTWKVFTVPVQSFCNGDLMRPITIKCWDWDNDGSSVSSDEFEFAHFWL
jgi:Ca2+-dependent lipid-binding protein